MDTDTARLVRIDLATGATEVLAEDPEADVSGVAAAPGHPEPQIVTFLKDRTEYLVLDPVVADDLAAIRALHPGDPACSNARRRRQRPGWSRSPTTPGPVPFYTYDRATKQGRFLFEHQPALSQYELAPMEPFSFTARDGLTMHGYVTFPPGGGPRRACPPC